MKKIKETSLALIFLTLSLPLLIFGFSLEYPLPGLGENPTLEDYVRVLITFLSGLAGLILFSVFVYGGFLYLISAADPEKKTEAKRKIRQGIVGVSLLLLLYLIYWTLFHKASVFIPKPPKWPTSPLPQGIYICKEEVNKLPSYFNKDSADEAIREIREKCEHYSPHLIPIEDISFEPRFLFNLPSNPWANPSYNSMVIIGDDYQPDEVTRFEQKVTVGYRIGEIKGIIKFEGGKISFPDDGKSIVILEKTSPPSGYGITLYACSNGWDESKEKCPERIEEITGTVVYPIPATGDFQEISPPKEGEVDFSLDTRAIEVDEGISAIFCNSDNDCTVVKGPQQVNIEDLAGTDVAGLSYYRREGSNLVIYSDIKKIYIIKGTW